MFSFPDEPSWNEARDAVEFAVELGDYRGACFVPRRVVHDLIGHRPTPEECMEYFHLARTDFERVVEQKIVARELDQDANIQITTRDVRRFRRGSL